MKKATSLSLLASAFLAAPAVSQTPGFSTVVELSGNTGSALGSEPAAALMEHSNGDLYGTTLSGGPANLGTIYRLTKAGAFTNLVSLTGATGLVGFYPWCTLAEAADGYLWGVNQGNESGIMAAGFGNVFKFNPLTTPVGYSSVSIFSGKGQPNRGQNPRGGFLRVGNDLYCTTVAGGVSTNNGTILKTSITTGFNTYLLDFSFTGTVNRGAEPNARLIDGNDGYLYGTTVGGGTGDFGTVYRVNTTTGILSTIVEFTGNASPNPGKSPTDALLIASDGHLYGTTQNGGISRDINGILYNAGTVFRYNRTTGTMTTLAEFTGANGAVPGAGPSGNLVQAADGYLYGATRFTGPGATGNGTIFRVSLTGQIQPRLVEFTGLTGLHKGEQPYGGLMKTTQGIIYGTTMYGGVNDRGTIWKLNPALIPNTVPVVTTGAASGVTGTAATLNGIVNPNSLATAWQFEYGTTTAYGTLVPATAGTLPAGTADQAVNTGISGLTPNTVYHFRLRGTSTAGTGFGSDLTFTTGTGGTQPPVVVTGAASNIVGTNATLNGTVNPQGNAATWQFEFGNTASYGAVSPATPGTTGSGSSAEAVNTALTGLPAGTTIHFRLKATNTGGTTLGTDQTFTTPGVPQAPAVVTGTASDITGTGAVLNGTVNPRGTTATWRFEYGPDLAFGSFVPVTPATLGNGITPESVSIPVTGLTPGTTVYYRLLASNEVGTVTGSNGTFTTATPPDVVTQAAIGVSNTGATLVGTVDPNGNASSWQFEYGPNTSYGSLAPVLAGTTGSGTSPESVSTTLSGLTPGVTIHYRLRATNGAGTGTGNDFSFTTKQAPTVTASTQSLTATSVTLAGTVNPHGFASTWQFDYGTTVAYGTSVPAVAGATGTGNAPENVSFPLAGLQPNTAYHFRLRAVSANGTTNGPDLTFTTNNNLSGWRQQNFGTTANTGNAANTADPDGDGVINLLEYSFGMNPNIKDQQLLPVPSYNGSTLIVSFTSPPGVFDILYGAEVSTNLVNWAGPIADSGTGNVHSFVSPVSPTGKNYMHLKVAVIP